MKAMLLAPMLGAILSAYAADDTVSTLPVIEVKGANTPDAHAAQRIQHAREALEQRAGGTAVIDAEDYRQGRAASLSDTMAYTPGVYAQTRHGDETRFSIRGSGIQRGFLMRGIQLYQDGIPLNHADGAGDFQSIDPLAAQYIEVWRGANALEYGGNALGGAVNFVTPTGRTAPAVTLRAQGGSFGMRQGQAAFAGANESMDAYLSISRTEQDGYRVHSGSEATRISGNVGIVLTPTLQARLFLTHIDSDMQMPGSLSRAAMLANPRNAAPNYAERNAGNNYDLNRLAMRVDWTPSDRLTWTTSAFISDKDRFHPMTMGILKQNARDTGIDTRAVFDLAEGKLVRRLVLGASAARLRADEYSYTNIAGTPGTLTQQKSLTGQQFTAYGEYSHGLTEQWILQIGAQAVRAERDRHDAYSASTPAVSYTKNTNGFSPKLGLIHHLSERSQVYANLSRSLEAPPFGELVYNAAVPLASPQKATTAELGYRYRAGDVWLDATVYRARIDGELLALNDANGVSRGTVNADRTIHQGVEFGAQLPLNAQTRTRMSYLYNDFRFDNDDIYGNKRLAGIAPHVLRAEVKWQPMTQFYIAPNIEWLQGKTWVDHANTLAQDGYTLLGITVGGQLTRQVRWFIDGRNLTDRRYVASTAVQTNVNGSDGAWYFPGDGRALYAGIEWRM